MIITSANAQISGCTDSLSKNYSPNATINDGGCQYPSLNLKPKYSIRLSDTIRETSGLLYFDNLLWTHNDDHDKTIYGIDSLGQIQKKVVLYKEINHDWEEITQDSSYLYIGDFGNNFAGNRIDLHILKIDKKSFLDENPIIETISFTYSDQNHFSSQEQNTHQF
jgi:hypothetical protein